MNLVAKYFGNYKDVNYKNEILSGLTVAIALVPEAIAFSFIAGVDPLVGLYAACIMGFFTSILGGRPGMISGSTGAIAVVVASTVQHFGEAYLYPTIILGGLIQMIIGFSGFGKFIRLVPHSVMLGFVNGLAIVIFLAQFPMFYQDPGNAILYSNSTLVIMIGLVLLTMAIMFLLPRFSKLIPGGLAAILVVAGISMIPGVDTPTVTNLLQGKSMEGGLPQIFMSYPANLFSLETLKIIFLPALSVAGVGLIESLLTLTLIDEKTDTRGNGSRESVAQGIANVISGLFGSMGGCAMIGQSMININSGARKRLSGIVAALALLAFIMYLSDIIVQIPVAALIGIMFMVSYGTFEWSSLKDFKLAPKGDFVIMVTVALITVFFHNLALAVLVGVIMAALLFSWDNAVRIRARKRVDEDNVKHYDIYGPLFFGSITSFMEKFDIKNDPQKVVIDFEESRVADQSGVEAIKKVHSKYNQAQKEVSFVNLSQGCKELLLKAKIEVTVDPDKPKYEMVYNDELEENIF